jgi:type II secretory ATPase GspE/PulE/Tfp pilus assembly ATPase PilB-like protein
MGVEPFLLASSLEGILAQRLVRKICPKCKQAYHPEEHLIKSMSGEVSIKPGAKFYHGVGCPECNQTGMSGRVGIFELIRITSKIRDMIASRPTSDQIVRAAPADHVSMVHDGIAKVLEGSTTVEEIFRVAKSIVDEG